MKNALPALAAVSLFSGLMMGQNLSYSGRLVAAGCQDARQTTTQASNGSLMPTKGYEDNFPYYTAAESPHYNAQSQAEASGEADRMVNNRKTGASQNSVEEQNINNDWSQSKKMNQQGEESRQMATNSVEEANINNDWSHNGVKANAVSGPCRISMDTTSYALQLPDGRMIPFNSSSNLRISQQLRSGRLAKTGTVNVRGTMQHGMISLKSISQ
jgi:hypothetical protein